MANHITLVSPAHKPLEEKQERVASLCDRQSETRKSGTQGGTRQTGPQGDAQHALGPGCVCKHQRHSPSSSPPTGKQLPVEIWWLWPQVSNFTSSVISAPHPFSPPVASCILPYVNSKCHRVDTCHSGWHQPAALARQDAHRKRIPQDGWK